ncbi:MAG: hypothetical protein ACE5I0_03810 [Candidatus Binatia bacterium]
MPIKIYKEKIEYLARMLEELPKKTDPADYRSGPEVVVNWVEHCSGRTKIRNQELVSDELAHTTGFGRGVGPAQTFLAGFAFSHFTQWGRAAGVLDLDIDSLEERVRGCFDRRGEYLYELGYEHKGLEEIVFEVKIESRESRDRIRDFGGWAERSPLHATLRRAVRLIGVFHLNGQRLATTIYHPGCTEWR